MSTKIIETVRGKDGKRYPAGLPLLRADRIKIIQRLHELVHGLGYSEREAQRILLAEGWRRSAGSIHNDLERPMCPACRVDGEHWRRAAAGAAAPAPESPEAVTPAWSPGAGWAGPAPA